MKNLERKRFSELSAEQRSEVVEAIASIYQTVWYFSDDLQQWSKMGEVSKRVISMTAIYATEDPTQPEYRPFTPVEAAEHLGREIAWDNSDGGKTIAVIREIGADSIAARVKNGTAEYYPTFENLLDCTFTDTGLPCGAPVSAEPEQELFLAVDDDEKCSMDIFTRIPDWSGKDWRIDFPEDEMPEEKLRGRCFKITLTEDVTEQAKGGDR